MYVLLGLLIGFVAAIPLGPVNIFVISQALKRDFRHAFMAGLTAAVLDMVYCLVAVLGISRFTFGLNLVKLLPFIKLFAAAVLAVMGVHILRQSKACLPVRPSRNPTSFSPRPMFGVVLLYISNPSLYAFWLAVAAMVSHFEWMVSGPVWAKFLFAFSCGVGGICWYFILTRYVCKYHHQFQPKTFQTIFLVLAIVLFAFAAFSIASIFFSSVKLL